MTKETAEELLEKVGRWIIYWEARETEKGFVSYGNGREYKEYDPVPLEKARFFVSKKDAEQILMWYNNRKGFGHFSIHKVEKPLIYLASKIEEAREEERERVISEWNLTFENKPSPEVMQDLEQARSQGFVEGQKQTAEKIIKKIDSHIRKVPYVIKKEVRREMDYCDALELVKADVNRFLGGEVNKKSGGKAGEYSKGVGSRLKHDFANHSNYQDGTGGRGSPAPQTDNKNKEAGGR